MPKFHQQAGSLVVLDSDFRSARRRSYLNEFNNGLVFSHRPLRDYQVFSVRIVDKTLAWSGSIEIGVTACNPSTLTPLPCSASNLTRSAWVMSGFSVLRDGFPSCENYGLDLESLKEDDTVGVMRTSDGDLHFYVNGVDLGVAARNVPSPVWAVVDLYGKCVRVVIVNDDTDLLDDEDDIDVEQRVSTVPAESAGSPVLSLPQSRSSLDLDSVEPGTAAAQQNTPLSLALAMSQLQLDHMTNLSRISAALDMAGGANGSASRLERPERPNTLNVEPTSAAAAAAAAACGGAAALVDEDIDEDPNEGGSLAAAADVGHDALLDDAEELTFHRKCGTLVRLSTDRRVAERRKPFDEFNNGVVVSSRPLRDNELFKIRIDKLVQKWSGSIEVGITSHNPERLTLPSTMTQLRSGTIIMSGAGILMNGKGTHREYGKVSLDCLKVGDRIGLRISPEGDLRYYINGRDQGVAASRVSRPQWAVVDLYGMSVKVTLVSRGLLSGRSVSQAARQSCGPQLSALPSSSAPPLLSTFSEDEDQREETEKLTFSPAAPFGVQISDGATRASGQGELLSNRPLRLGEPFALLVVSGSVQVSVTTGTGPPSGRSWSLSEPVRAGPGTSLSVCVRRDGVRFARNDEDLGAAPNSAGVSAPLYARVLLDGEALIRLDACYLHYFHERHGRNVALLNNKRTARRTNPSAEFNDAVCLSARPLLEDEIFEIRIDHLVDRWSGSLEAGVIAAPPSQFPTTLTDIRQDCWLLSGSTVMRDGATVRTGYPLDLDDPAVVRRGDRIGICVKASGELHFYHNDADMGPACSAVPLGVYAVVDLYGQCAAISLCPAPPPLPHASFYASADAEAAAAAAAAVAAEEIDDPAASGGPAPAAAAEDSADEQGFSASAAAESKSSAARNETAPSGAGFGAFSDRVQLHDRIRATGSGLVFSSRPLKPDHLFEVSIDQLASGTRVPASSGTPILGLSEGLPRTSSSCVDIRQARRRSWLVGQDGAYRCSDAGQLTVLQLAYARCLRQLAVGDRLAIHYASDGGVSLLVNETSLGRFADTVPRNCFAFVQFGSPTCPAVEELRFLRQAPCRLPRLTHRPGQPLESCLDATVTTNGDEADDAGNVDGEDNADRGEADKQRAVADSDKDVDETEATSGTGNVNDDDDVVVDTDGSEQKQQQQQQQGFVVAGANCAVSSDRLTARRRVGFCHAVAACADPLEPAGRPVLFQLDSLTAASASGPAGSVSLGLLRRRPSHRDQLAATLVNQRGEPGLLLCVVGDSVYGSGLKLLQSGLSVDLDTLSEGDTVGLMLDAERRPRLIGSNGRPSEPIGEPVGLRPVYPAIDIYGRCSQASIVATPDSASSGSGVLSTNPTSVPTAPMDPTKIAITSVATLASTSTICSQRRRAQRWLERLALPAALLRPKYDSCACRSCASGVGGVAASKSLETAKSADDGAGWTKFGLRVSTSSPHILSQQLTRWVLAYLPVPIGQLRCLLDSPDPVLLSLAASSPATGDSIDDDESAECVDEASVVKHQLTLFPSAEQAASQPCRIDRILRYRRHSNAEGDDSDGDEGDGNDSSGEDGGGGGGDGDVHGGAERRQFGELLVEVRLCPGAFAAATLENRSPAQQQQQQQQQILVTKELGAVLCTGLLFRPCSAVSY
ncbi:hypothetical protein BOX15_Mlig004187g1 [Macrostomum lignano]|uniref:Neuralized-like protein 4 n=2 Tax=Macrostomum lignano TaxID=282301 RepID=A0A267FJX3_9PLAT|nr:hypothetical protein BOX15_Mlig004187g1 [Macrostomum lignano]